MTGDREFSEEFSLETMDGRRALMDALAAKGIESSDSDTGGGFHAVEVVLVPDDGHQGLSILATAMDSPCEIGLGGMRTTDDGTVDCGSAELLRPPTLGVAVEAFETFLANRTAFTRDFHAGKYDF